MSERFVVVEADAAIAGGPLDTLNRSLQALAVARTRTATGEAHRAVLLLKDRARGRDRQLLLLNDKGDPVHITGPETGVLDEHSRAAMAAAAVDNLPATNEAHGAVDALLPRVQVAPLAAAQTLWESLLGRAGLLVQAHSEWNRGARVSIGDTTVDTEQRIEPLAVTWFGPRHLALLAELGVQPADALAGEAWLRERCDERYQGRVLEETERFAEQSHEGIARLETLVNEEDPRLLGAWLRLRRNHKKALTEFAKKARHQARNRHGIRGARLHRLAQAIRPHDAPQSEHLGLLAAAALFRLDLSRLEAAVDAFADATADAPLCLAAESGRRLA